MTRLTLVSGWLNATVFTASLLVAANTSALEAVSVQPAAITPSAYSEPILEVAAIADAEADPLSQVTSVSQLSDVQPTDWAFQALQSLVERYGCIAGYPDGTYRGNRALTRYEFAAGMNACLDRVNELIAAGTDDLVSKEDLATLQRLQEEFSAELATLRGRVDALEARTAELEANQFSTTTKLAGEAIFAVSDAFGDDVDAETVLSDRVRLNLLTSFTGKDRLRTRLQAGNPGTSFSSQIGTNEGRFTYDGTTGNNVAIDILDYRFPVTDKAYVNLFANAALHHHYADTVNPYLESFGGGSGALSRFAERNPIYRIGGNAAGIGVNYQFSEALKLDLGYLANEASSPNEGDALFDGNYSALAQLVFQPFDQLKLGFTYVHSYSGLDTPFNFGGTGTNLANRPWSGGGFGATPVSSNSYGVEASFRVSPQLLVGGWFGLTNARLIGLGDSKILNYAVTLTLPDLGKKGNLAGIIVGAEPYLSDISVPGTSDIDEDIPLHIEGFYKYQLTDNISVTPGVIWLTAPNQNNNNEDVIIGTLRTTFNF